MTWGQFRNEYQGRLIHDMYDIVGEDGRRGALGVAETTGLGSVGSRLRCVKFAKTWGEHESGFGVRV